MLVKHRYRPSAFALGSRHLALIAGAAVSASGCVSRPRHAMELADGIGSKLAHRSVASVPSDLPVPNKLSVPNDSATPENQRVVPAAATMQITPEPIFDLSLNEVDGPLERGIAEESPDINLPIFDSTRSNTYASDAMTLAAWESLALSNNPTLAQLAATTQKAAGFRTQVGLKPNPTVGYQAVQLADRDTDQHTAFIEQEFVTADKLSYNRRVLNEAVRAQQLEWEAQRQRVVTDIRIKFAEALAAQQRIQLISDFQSVSDKGYELAILRKEALEGSQIDVLQAKIQKNEIDLAVRQARIAFETAWQELAALAGVPSMLPRQLDGQLDALRQPLDWSAVSAGILSASPEYQAAEARVAQARADIARQNVQAVPNFTFQFAAGVDDSTNSGMINLQLGAPIPVFNENQGNIAAARAEYCRALQEVQRIRSAIQNRLGGVARQYDSALAAVIQYADEILPAAKETLSLAETAYKAGETDFLQVLVARRTYFETNLQYLSEQASLTQAQAQLDGYLLTGALDPTQDLSGDDSLRGLTFGQQ